jgi:hypothetical protein
VAAPRLPPPQAAAGQQRHPQVAQCASSRCLQLPLVLRARVQQQQQPQSQGQAPRCHLAKAKAQELGLLRPPQHRPLQQLQLALQQLLVVVVGGQVGHVLPPLLGQCALTAAPGPARRTRRQHRSWTSKWAREEKQSGGLAWEGRGSGDGRAEGKQETPASLGQGARLRSVGDHSSNAVHSSVKGEGIHVDCGWGRVH